VNIVAEQKQASLVTIFLFFKFFIALNSFTAPLHYRCFGVPGRGQNCWLWFATVSSSQFKSLTFC